MNALPRSRRDPRVFILLGGTIGAALPFATMVVLAHGHKASLRDLVAGALVLLLETPVVLWGTPRIISRYCR